jgi:dTDP-4-amino-4,6-dideoxygalactose transaminase
MASTIGREMILMNDFQAEPAELREQMASAIAAVIESGSFILGHQVEEFERQWANQSATKYCIGVGNGMDAIEIGLRGIGVGPNDEVITTPMTAFATVLAIMRAGATPVFADIDHDTAMLEPESVKRCITRRTKAIILVHLYGQAGPIEQLLSLVRDSDICLIEDCAQAHRALYKGRPVGSFGTFAAWSFYPTKNLGAIGDAGALTTSEEKLAESATIMRNYGQSSRGHHSKRGLNSRLDEIQAAALLARLPYLGTWTDRRRSIANRYHAEIRHPHVRLLAKPVEAEQHVYHLFVITSRYRAALKDHLKSQGVESLIHYPTPAHFQNPCQRLPCDPLGLKHAERHAEECLSLPSHPNMSDADIDSVIEAVNAFRPGPNS